MTEHPNGNNGNGNGEGHHNGNGNGHSNGNGNGHGASQGVYLPKDRFAAVDLTKPRLFPTKREVVKKTGIWKNLALFILICSAALAWFASPKSMVRDSKAVVVPSRRVDFASPRDGFVTQVFFKEGDSVREGDLLLTVESKDERARIDDTQWEIKAFRKELSAEKDEARLLFLKLSELKRLHQMGSLREEVVEEAGLGLQVKEKRIASLRIKLNQTQERENFLKNRIHEGEIRAPFKGKVISDIGLREKAFVKEGDFLFTLASEDSLVEMLIKEGDYARIEPGGRARVKFYAFPERTYEGLVAGFKHFAEPLPKSGITRHAVRVLVRMNTIPLGIQNGMSAKVTLEAKSQSPLRRFYDELF